MHPAPDWIIGSAESDLTPDRSVFLYGYPHAQRMSSGIHDRLLSSAIYLSDNTSAAIFVANDIIWVPRNIVQNARQRISRNTGVPAGHIMITASHTHSGPVVSRMLSNQDDPYVPDPDPQYLTQLEDAIVAAATNACKSARPATLSIGSTSIAGLGTNRHDPSGAMIESLPVLIARDRNDDRPLAIMCVCAMHPTVLHEDWTQISGDFPGLAREHLSHDSLDCPLVYHMGPAGDQSPRHVVRGNTIEEADRLGRLLADKIRTAIDNSTPIPAGAIRCQSASTRLPLRELPPIKAAWEAEIAARVTLDRLRTSGAPAAQIRTAECDLFGAEETVTLAQAAAEGTLAAAAEQCLPAEVQAITIGHHTWIGWPGEVFVDFALQILRDFNNVSIISLANGELQGYLVTEAAVAARTYESGNALFQSPDSGQILVDVTRKLLAGTHP